MDDSYKAKIYRSQKRINVDTRLEEHTELVVAGESLAECKKIYDLLRGKK